MTYEQRDEFCTRLMELADEYGVQALSMFWLAGIGEEVIQGGVIIDKFSIGKEIKSSVHETMEKTFSRMLRMAGVVEGGIEM